MRCPTYIVPHTVPRRPRPAPAGAACVRSVAESKVNHPFFPTNLSQRRLKPTNLFVRQKHFLCVRLRPDGMTVRRTHGTVCFLWKALLFRSALIGFFFPPVPEGLQPHPPLFQLFFFKFVSSEHAAGTWWYSLPNSLGLGGEKANRNTLSRLFMWMKNGNSAVYFSFCTEYARRPMFVLDRRACVLFPRVTSARNYEAISWLNRLQNCISSLRTLHNSLGVETGPLGIPFWFHFIWFDQFMCL